MWPGVWRHRPVRRRRAVLGRARVRVLEIHAEGEHVDPSGLLGEPVLGFLRSHLYDPMRTANPLGTLLLRLPPGGAESPLLRSGIREELRPDHLEVVVVGGYLRQVL